MSTLPQSVATFNLLGDESRLRLCALLHDRELSVTDLVRATGISQSRVSTHLARLREGGFVRDRRDGQHTFYALALSGVPSPVEGLFRDAVTAEDPTFVSDRARLRTWEAEQARSRGGLLDSFAGSMDRHYSPGRTWPSLLVGLSALLSLGDVLDVGSGDGSAATFVAPHCSSLTCIDKSPRMVEAARARLRKFEHARALVADASALPFASSSFDCVLVFHTLTYAESPAKVVSECARVLRAGGKLVVLSLDAHNHTDITQPYGERHAGISPKALRTLLSRAKLTVAQSDVAFVEHKKPHFQVVLAVAHKSSK